jgi:hypothetical protein
MELVRNVKNKMDSITNNEFYQRAKEERLFLIVFK